MSHLHLMDPPLPDALLVDDLHLLSDLPPPATGAGGGGGDHRPRPRDMALCRILASLYEAVVSLPLRLTSSGSVWCGGEAATALARLSTCSCLPSPPCPWWPPTGICI